MQPATPSVPLPRAPGTYVLVLRVENPITVMVGKLGAMPLAPGWLLYVGSAFGPGGLAGRLRHHLRPTAKPHWHIDYLRAALPLIELWLCPAPQRLEHCVASLLHAAPGSRLPLPRCGASDCGCPAHLFAFAARPTPRLLNVAGDTALPPWEIHLPPLGPGP
jgi:Uri superfamily endonuclease